MQKNLFNVGQFILNNYKKTIYIALLCNVILAIAFLPFLPSNVPMQWSTNGTVNYFLPKYIAALIMPALTTFLSIVGRYKHKELFYFMVAVFFSVFQIGLFLFIALNY